VYTLDRSHSFDLIALQYTSNLTFSFFALNEQTSLPGFGQNPASLDINVIQLKPYYNVVHRLCEHRLQGNGIALASAFAEAYQNAHKDQVCMMFMEKIAAAIYG